MQKVRGACSETRQLSMGRTLYPTPGKYLKGKGRTNTVPGRAEQQRLAEKRGTKLKRAGSPSPSARINSLSKLTCLTAAW